MGVEGWEMGNTRTVVVTKNVEEVGREALIHPRRDLTVRRREALRTLQVVDGLARLNLVDGGRAKGRRVRARVVGLLTLPGEAEGRRLRRQRKGAVGSGDCGCHRCLCGLTHLLFFFFADGSRGLASSYRQLTNGSFGPGALPSP